jgi:hypothetical protein
VASPSFAQFIPGDVYLASGNIPGPGAPCGTATVLRFDPATWQATVLAHPGVGFSSRIGYSPARSAMILGYGDSSLELMSSTGVRTPLPYSGGGTAQLFAPTPDGRIYIWGTAANQVRYYDAANGLHTVLDASGAAPLTYTGSVGAMTYDPGTNSIFFSSMVAGDLTRVTRLPLNAAGTAMQGASTQVTFDASPGFNAEQAVGFSRGPSGGLFLAIDDNGGGEIGRLQLINPATMAQQAFATPYYFGVAAQTAAAYVPAINKAVVYDTLEGKLRTYPQGGHGEGTIVVSQGLSGGCMSGPAAQMIVIDPPPPCSADIGSTGGVPGQDGVLNNNDFVVFIGWFFNGAPAADRGSTGGVHAPDGHFDNNDFIVFIDQFFAGC